MISSQQVNCVELAEPEGWICIPLNGGEPSTPLRTNMLQIAVLANHQNGRDTHVRLVNVYTSLA